jgi:hypothetical protein
MITTVEKKGLRKKLINACIAKQQFLIDDFKERLRELRSDEALNNQPYDTKDIAAQAERTTEINNLNMQIDFANIELDILQTLGRSPEADRDYITPGAIVITNHYTFFISASLEKITVDGHVYIGISTHSPIYKAMEGKIKGDTFTYNNVHYKIKDIF